MIVIIHYLSNSTKAIYEATKIELNDIRQQNADNLEDIHALRNKEKELLDLNKKMAEGIANLQNELTLLRAEVNMNSNNLLSPAFVPYHPLAHNFILMEICYLLLFLSSLMFIWISNIDYLKMDQAAL